MTGRQKEDLRNELDKHTLGDLLRIGLMLALRDKRNMTAYFLEMALVDYEGEAVL